MFRETKQETVLQTPLYKRQRAKVEAQHDRGAFGKAVPVEMLHLFGKVSQKMQLFGKVFQNKSFQKILELFNYVNPI